MTLVVKSTKSFTFKSIGKADSPKWLRATLVVASLLIVIPAIAQATVYYEYELAAQTGTSSLVSIEDEVSINDRGRVAFIGDQNAAAGFESVYVGAPGSLAVSINPTFSASGRTFGPGVEINAASPSQVAARDSVGTSRFFRLWDAVSGAFTTLDSDAGPYDDVGFRPGVNDANQGVHGAFTGVMNFLDLPGGSAVMVGSLVATRPAIANDGSVVARVGLAANEMDPIVYYDAAGTAKTVASTTFVSSWTQSVAPPGSPTMARSSSGAAIAEMASASSPSRSAICP